jgi:hypothetical protein
MPAEPDADGEVPKLPTPELAVPLFAPVEAAAEVDKLPLPTELLVSPRAAPAALPPDALPSPAAAPAV